MTSATSDGAHQPPPRRSPGACRRQAAVLVHVVERLAGRGGNGRGGKQERKARRRFARHIAEQPRRDGDAAARRARHDGQRLRQAVTTSRQNDAEFALTAARRRPATSTSPPRSAWPITKRLRQVVSACLLKSNPTTPPASWRSPAATAARGSCSVPHRRHAHAEPLRDNLHPVAKEIDQHGEQRADVQRDIEPGLPHSTREARKSGTSEPCC